MQGGSDRLGRSPCPVDEFVGTGTVKGSRRPVQRAGHEIGDKIRPKPRTADTVRTTGRAQCVEPDEKLAQRFESYEEFTFIGLKSERQIFFGWRGPD